MALNLMNNVACTAAIATPIWSTSAVVCSIVAILASSAHPYFGSSWFVMLNVVVPDARSKDESEYPGCGIWETAANLGAQKTTST